MGIDTDREEGAHEPCVYVAMDRSRASQLYNQESYFFCALPREASESPGVVLIYSLGIPLLHSVCCDHDMSTTVLGQVQLFWIVEGALKINWHCTVL